MKKITLTVSICLMGLILFGQKPDVDGSKDYDLLNRMPNYYIKKYWEYDFDQHNIKASKTETVTVEGKKIVITYEHQQANNKNVEKPSYLQILRNYSNAIKKGGGEILFEHKNNEYGYYSMKTKLGKEIWLEIKPAPNLGRRYSLVVVEKELMKQDITLNADIIKESIELNGKISIYGIYFDIGKSIIKENSKEALNQIAKYLNDNPKVNCWVVGHTDSDGSFDLNSKLSLDRARAVKKYLEENYDIDPNRLFAEGVGPLAPVSSNSTEAGKKLNRRVELVKK